MQRTIKSQPSWNDGDRHPRQMNHFSCDGPEQQSFQISQPARAHHDLLNARARSELADPSMGTSNFFPADMRYSLSDV
jgi:hypothetical protein